jgi:four helix bundle protein
MRREKMAGSFRKLLVWQRSKALAVEIYRLTGTSPFTRDFGLRDQLRRAAISVCSNIAEGESRQTDKESAQFFFVSKGSLAEVSAQLEIAGEVHPLDPAVVAKLLRECEEVSAMLQALIDHRRR